MGSLIVRGLPLAFRPPPAGFAPPEEEAGEDVEEDVEEAAAGGDELAMTKSTLSDDGSRRLTRVNST